MGEGSGPGESARTRHQPRKGSRKGGKDHGLRAGQEEAAGPSGETKGGCGASSPGVNAGASGAA